MSFKRFQEYIDSHYASAGISVSEDLVPQMKEQIIKSMHGVRKKIDPKNRKHCFELFGYDFILDEDFNMWLIEVNTNPCIEESSNLLKRYLPRMIEDMLKLTIDVIFPRPKRCGKKKTLSTVKESSKKNDLLEKIDEESVGLDNVELSEEEGGAED